jgi:hypothetical protein
VSKTKYMRNLNNPKARLKLLVACFCVTIFAGGDFAKAQIAVGGNYTLTQTSIAGGGASGTAASTGANYSVEGTIGQSAAGAKQQNSPYTFQPGFWTTQIFAPTAAGVTVGGRVVTANGAGIGKVRVVLTSGSGETRTAISSGFGYFRFDNVTTGETYVFSVNAKKYTFSQPVQVRSIFEDTDDLLFTSDYIERVLMPQFPD